jgi:hypothetical protein
MTIMGLLLLLISCCCASGSLLLHRHHHLADAPAALQVRQRSRHVFKPKDPAHQWGT